MSTTWTLQIFKLSDRAPDELIARIVRAVDGLVVRQTSEDGEHFLVIESGKPEEPQIVHDLVMVLDKQAELVHRSDGVD